MSNVCIVTPDIVGPIKNGGIGTHCYCLALALRDAGHQVTIFYTGPFENANAEHHREWYAARSIALVVVCDAPEAAAPMRTNWFLDRSYRTYLYLRQQAFDVIHFQDWQANGFHAIQAKRTTSDFLHTKLTVTMHSSTEWIHEGMRQWLVAPLEEAKLQWCERYCCANSDLLISPSEYMIRWAESRQWTLPANRVIAPCPIDREGISPATRPAGLRIAFFGRLEERKGLVIFCDALRLIPEGTRARIETIYFIGKLGDTSAGKAGGFIRQTMDACGVGHEIHTNFDSFQARSFIKQTGAVAIIPSLLDNLPLTVIECCCDGIPVIASNAGGIPELLPPEQLFPPTPRGIAGALTELIENPDFRFGTLYDPLRARQIWLDLTATATCPGDDQRSGVGPNKAIEVIGNPLVSICVPHFNYGKYLPLLLDSILASSYQNFEVIVIDDDSTDQHSREVFDRIASSPPDDRFHLSRKVNGGVGHTRNHAANQARGEYLIFMDADNLATPSMIERFLVGIQRSGVAALACHFKAFDAGIHPNADTRPEFIYAPIGPAVEIGWAENVFGDANFIIRRDVFTKLGGFGTERDSSWEDHEILARLSLSEHSMDVIPEALFWYRYTPEGFSRNTNPYLNHRRVLRTYANALPPRMRWLAESVLPGYLYDSPATMGTAIGKKVGDTLNRIVDRLLPPNSYRRERAFRVLQRFL